MTRQKGMATFTDLWTAMNMGYKIPILYTLFDPCHCPEASSTNDLLL